MTRRRLFVLLGTFTLVSGLAGCATGKPSLEYADSPFAEKITLTYDLGVSIPVSGDILTDADPRVGGAVQAAYMFTPNAGLQGMFVGLSATEENEDFFIGGQQGSFFGELRQETAVFGLTVGPRFAAPIPLGEDESGPVLEPFVEGGFGGYFTRIHAKFRDPISNTTESGTDITSDFGLNGGGGLILRLSETFYIGGVVRVHVVFFRPEGDEDFMKDCIPCRVAMFDDSGGGPSDELVFLEIGAVAAIRF